MASALFKIGLSVVALLAILFQVFLKDAVWLGLGIGKTMQPLSDFPYTCRSIFDSRLEACEDMWMSESTRQIFLACSDPIARSKWMPNVGDFNYSARSQKDAFVVLDIDKPADDGFAMRTLKTPGFAGTAGDGLLNLVGFTAVDNPESRTIDLLAINQRPSVDAETGKYLDHSVVGANITIELFHMEAGASEMKHITTFADKHIATPNRITAISKDSFYLTNDHGLNKVGLKHALSPFLGTGDVAFCQKGEGCKTVAEGLHFPNGLVRGQDGLIYVPSSMKGKIAIYKPLPDSGLEKVDEIYTGFALDNMSVDKSGAIYVAAFPKGIEVYKAYQDPYNHRAPATMLRLRKTAEGGYAIDKVIEDAAGEKLPATTTVIHDAKTGRLFMSSVVSPFIAVCEPKN